MEDLTQLESWWCVTGYDIAKGIVDRVADASDLSSDDARSPFVDEVFGLVEQAVEKMRLELTIAFLILLEDDAPDPDQDLIGTLNPPT